MEEQDGWLNFASSAFGTVAQVVPQLVTAGQQNRTYRELELERIEGANAIGLEGVKQQGILKSSVLIAALVCGVALVLFFIIGMSHKK